MLAFLILAIFVASPLVATGILSPILIDVSFSLLLVSGVFAVSRRRSAVFGVALVAFLTLAVRWAYQVSQGSSLAVWSGALSLLSLSILAIFVLARVFRRGPITLPRIEGAVAVYLLLGLVWAEGYDLLEILRPGALHIGLEAPAGHLVGKLAYFSFVTLTTVGYGDITPVHPVARSLAVAEALVGQLYPAILIARLVSMELLSHRRD